MICDERDADLLLLAHEELPPLRRLRTLAHVRRCARCRGRLDQLQTVSIVIAQALRLPNRPVWPPVLRRPFPRRGIGLGGWLQLISLLVLVALLCFLTFLVIINLSGTRAAAVKGSAEVGCTPGLPSDRCR